MLQIILLLCTLPSDGTLVFVVNGPYTKLVERQTGSPVSHAAIILYENNTPVVYEATPPKVQKTPLTSWLKMAKELNSSYPKMDVIYVSPNWTQKQLYEMKRYAESQLGRPYAARGYMFHREVRGVHCAQFVADVLKAGGIKTRGVNESPGTLLEESRKW